MYTCNQHGWRSHESPCPACQIVQDASGGEDVVFYVPQSPAPTKEGLDNNRFSQEEICAAKAVKRGLLDGSIPEELKCVYMAGELCMWDEIMSKSQPSSPDPTVLVQALKTISGTNVINGDDSWNNEDYIKMLEVAVEHMRGLANDALNKYNNKKEEGI